MTSIENPKFTAFGPVNDAPTISPVAPQTVPENMPLDPVTFTVGDIESDAATLTVTATSSNQAIVPDANLTLGGSGATRTARGDQVPEGRRHVDRGVAHARADITDHDPG